MSTLSDPATAPYRLILVDDEAIVREGIARCVPWGSNGFTLVGIFEHGAEALTYIENNPVDVVISDINMPRMDGLTLSRILTARFPGIMILLLTGYDDFEYAREAVKHQVRQFLLKPITAAELETVLTGIAEELAEARTRERQQEQMLEKLRLSFPLLKERFLYRLVTGRIRSTEMEQRSDYFQWHDLKAAYRVLVLQLPSGWSDLEQLTLAETLKSLVSPWDEVFQNTEENIVLLLQDSETESLLTRGRKIARKAYQSAAEFENEQVIIGLGECVAAPERLQRSYEGAMAAVEYSRLLGVSQILSIDDVRERDRISPEGFNELTEGLLRQLREGAAHDSETALENIFCYLEDHYLTPSEAAHYFSRLHLQLSNFLQQTGILADEETEVFPGPQFFGSVTSAKSFFRTMIARVETTIRLKRHDMVNSRIEKAKEVIENRFSEPNFSLKDICDELYLSISQFSLLFKEGTGQTFVEYLTARRVEEAKKLLKTSDKKGYEVAAAAGYTDPRYFSLIFKKATGMTAMEYRRSLEA